MAIDITEWLRDLGLQQYEPAFRANDVDAEVLPKLTADDLISIGVTSVGHRRKLLQAIAALGPEVAANTLKPAHIDTAAYADAERRQLTVMFCDLVGSTPLSSQLDPEDYREVIAAYHRAIAATVGRLDGFVAKYMGDGILAYFGYPRAHEDDAERAVRAGLDSIVAVSRLNINSTKVQVRVGIATGLVIVGDLIGEGSAQEQSVVGETPNLAARLQALATPSSLVIASSTRQQIGELFELEDLGPQQLAGFVEPQRAWRVFGESDAVSRFEALHPVRSPLVGRDEEVELLLRRWERAKTGEGRVVLISAEPGIGKSRLAESLEERIAAVPHIRQRYFCSPLHKDSALFPVISQLERAAGFSRDDPAPTKQLKIAALFEDSTPDERSLVTDLLSLPAVQVGSEIELTPQRRKERTFDALMRNLERLTRRQPVLMLFEDLHWLDPTSRELLDHVVARVERLPVLLIATFRPEFAPPWIGLPHVTMLTLNPLSRRDCALLVERLVGNSGLPDDLIEEIVERTDGVPLFLEEMTKVVIETVGGSDTAAPGKLAAIPGAKLAVPATLQASLMARLDWLGPAAREIAQVGAAIGREFPYELLSVVLPRREIDTQAALAQLVAAGLLFQRGTPPSAEYQFKHALVQDTAYGTLLRGPRQALHGRIADALMSAESSAAAPEIIARHLENAGQSAQAIGHWREAAEQALRVAANQEAAAHLRSALSLLETQPETIDRRRTELTILSQLGAALMSVHGWSAPEVGDVVEQAAEVGRRLESSTDIAPAIANLWLFNSARGRLDRCSEISADLFRIAQELDDPAVMLQAHHCAWGTKFNLGLFAESKAHSEAGLAIYDESAHARHRHIYLGHDPGVCSFHFGALAQGFLGFSERGARLESEGVSLARRLQHPPSLAFSLWKSCESSILRGNVSAATTMAQELARLTDAHELPMHRVSAIMLLGWALSHSGETAQGIARQEQGLEMMGKMGMQLHLTFYLSLLAKSLLVAGRYSDGLQQIDRAIGISERRGEQCYLSRLYQLRAELRLQAYGQGDGAVEESLRQAIAVAQRQGAKGWEIGAATKLAHLWSERGRRAEAQDLLLPIYSWFTEGFDTPDLIAAKRLLDELK
jgi:class 3 adenylate cyclase/predicted ATPase